MKWVLIFAAGIVVGVGGIWGWGLLNKSKKIEIKKEYPLLKYTIENLGNRTYDSQIFIDDEVSDGVYKFHFDSDGKLVTGIAHIPDKCGKCQVIAQFRGHADKQNYYPGYGTEHSAQYFAKQGLISLAPDFLGYGGSASESANPWEGRFETYTTALNLIAGIEKWDKTKNIDIWGHSNGGQIALTTAEISKRNYPVAVWAPVSAPFPYSILYYTYDDPDHGKLLRNSLAEFERDYDVELYSLINFTELIRAPLLVQQGSVDESVPQKWSDDLVKKTGAEYKVYPGADHNLTPDWEQAVKDDVEFFAKHW